MRVPLVLKKLAIRTGLARLLPGVQSRMQGGAEFLHYYSDHLLAAPLDELAQLAEALQAQAPEVIDLTAGAPRSAPLPQTAGGGDRGGWPDPAGLPELRQAVAEKLLGEDRLAYHPGQEVLITSGALGAVHTALEAFVRRRDRVVLFDPCSPLYPLAVRTRRARVRWVLTWVEEGRLRFHLEPLAHALRGARMLVLNSPANPTGGVIAPEDLEQIAWWAQKHDVLLLSDEVFAGFGDREEVVSIATFPQAPRRTLVIGGVSKSHGLAALRTGWLAGYRHLLLPCRAAAGLRGPFVPTPCQQQALQALRGATLSAAEMRTRLRSRVRPARERLAGLGLESGAGSGYFLWIDVSPLAESGRAFASHLLEKQRVRVTPGDLFGPSGKARLRLSLAGDEGRLYEGLNRLAAFVGGLAERQEGAAGRAA